MHPVDFLTVNRGYFMTEQKVPSFSPHFTSKNPPNWLQITLIYVSSHNYPKKYLKVRLHNNVGNIPANLPWFFLACNCAISFKRAWMALQLLQQFGLTRYQNFLFGSTPITFRFTAIWKLFVPHKTSKFHTMSQ